MADQRDPAVDNLEAFIAVLTDTIDKVGAAQPGLEEQAQALATLHGEADQELGGFDGELDTGLSELNTLADQTKGELESLTTTASEGSDGTLSEAESAFEEWKDTLEETWEDAAETLSEASENLGSDGFDEAIDTARQAAGAVQASQGTTVAGFEALQASLKSEGDRFTGSLVTASLEAEGAAQAADVLESQFEGRANWITDDIQSASSSAAAVHAETGTQAGSFYDTVDARVQSETQELIGDVKGAFDRAAESMLEAATAPLEEPVDSLMADALDPFTEEVGNWKEQSDTAEQGLSTWDRHVADLAATLVVVEQIDELNKALE